MSSDSPAPIRVIIIDSEPALRRRTSAPLAADADRELVGVARSEAEGYRLAQAVEPAVILVAAPYGGDASLDLIRRLVAALPLVYIIVLSRTSDAPYLQAALRAGAKAFLSHPAPAEALIAAVKASPRPPQA